MGLGCTLNVASEDVSWDRPMEGMRGGEGLYNTLMRKRLEEGREVRACELSCRLRYGAVVR